MFLVVLSESTTNDSNYIYVQCSPLYFDSMTPYESNVNSLFTSLVDSSSVYNFNKFQISPPSGNDDVVYGLFQCRGDLSSSNCKECVTSSVNQLKTNCPVSTGGGIQLDGCLVKYDNSSFFGAGNKMEVSKRCGPSVGYEYNSDVLNRVDAALANLIAGNGQYFRSCDYGSIQGVAQCVQDLSASDCQDCLSEACGRLRSACVTSTWGDMYLGKCYIRYFDHDSDSSHEHEGISSSNKSSSSEGGSGSSDVLQWIGIILGAMTATGGVTAYAVTNHNENRNINDIKVTLESFKEKATEVVKRTRRRVRRDKPEGIEHPAGGMYSDNEDDIDNACTIM
uniref:plasmodesmata-located protein 6-like n=1 Tax=Erigeron canadensis TaxID=72917 RepID=UPI001CB98168|nr:plasmodesmata-located protein 6-like [Erigeron canadensis]